MSVVYVDARRLLCPMPVIKVQNAVEELEKGTVVEVVCTDPGALNDVPAWCRINGHRVLESRTEGNEVFIKIEVGDGA